MADGVDPITLQVLTGGLRAACEEMGAALIRSAYSANIKERHDCSTALFDARGELVMQAEHIPVHLGSMPDAVAAILGEEQRPGESWILNDPYRGGTHLPDITLIAPVFIWGALTGFAACRAHHADVGGPTPGSMPACSRTLDEEGEVIPPTLAGMHELREIAARMRFPQQRLADLRAQRAANRIGAERLTELAGRHGLALLREGMDEILAYAERRTRAALSDLPDGTYEAEDVLEDDAAGEPRDITLRVAATIAGDRLSLDFEGTDPQVDGNLNCPLSVTKSAAFFAVRAMTDPDAPPSAGAFRPIEVSAPEGCLLNARAPAAVVAGNIGDLEPGRRPGDRGADRRPAGARPGAGHDEQPDARRRGLHLLRDARRRPGSMPGRRRPERDPRRDVEHAQHAGRGARGGVPPARAGAGDPPRQRRRGRAEGRRRARPRDRSPGADALHACSQSAAGTLPGAATGAGTGPPAATC